MTKNRVFYFITATAMLKSKSVTYVQINIIMGVIKHDKGAENA
jgi:hypothetical protein